MVRRYSPFNELDLLQKQLNQIFEPVVQNACEATQTAQRRIPIDLTESPTQFKIRAMLPGIAPDNINIQATSKNLTLEANWAEQELEKEETCLYKELRTGSFKRSLEFEEPILNNQIEAKYEHGILTLTIPKREADQPQTIQVKVQS